MRGVTVKMLFALADSCVIVTSNFNELHLFVVFIFTLIEKEGGFLWWFIEPSKHVVLTWSTLLETVVTCVEQSYRELRTFAHPIQASTHKRNTWNTWLNFSQGDVFDLISLIKCFKGGSVCQILWSQIRLPLFLENDLTVMLTVGDPTLLHECARQLWYSQCFRAVPRPIAFIGINHVACSLIGAGSQAYDYIPTQSWVVIESTYLAWTMTNKHTTSARFAQIINHSPVHSPAYELKLHLISKQRSGSETIGLRHRL